MGEGPLFEGLASSSRFYLTVLLEVHDVHGPGKGGIVMHTWSSIGIAQEPASPSPGPSGCQDSVVTLREAETPGYHNMNEWAQT